MAGSAGSPPRLTVCRATKSSPWSVAPADVTEHLKAAGYEVVEYVPREQSDALASAVRAYSRCSQADVPKARERLFTAERAYREATSE